MKIGDPVKLIAGPFRGKRGVLTQAGPRFRVHLPDYPKTKDFATSDCHLELIANPDDEDLIIRIRKEFQSTFSTLEAQKMAAIVIIEFEEELKIMDSIPDKMGFIAKLCTLMYDMGGAAVRSISKPSTNMTKEFVERYEAKNPTTPIAPGPAELRPPGQNRKASPARKRDTGDEQRPRSNRRD